MHQTSRSLNSRLFLVFLIIWFLLFWCFDYLVSTFLVFWCFWLFGFYFFGVFDYLVSTCWYQASFSFLYFVCFQRTTELVKKTHTHTHTKLTNLTPNSFDLSLDNVLIYHRCVMTHAVCFIPPLLTASHVHLLTLICAPPQLGPMADCGPFPLSTSIS